MCRSMVDIQSATAEIRRGKNERRIRNRDKNIMSTSATQGGHNKQVVTRNVGRCPTWWPPCHIGGAVCKSSIIPFLVPRSKVWLTPTAGVSCINTANVGERKTWTLSEFCTWQNSVRRQEPQKCLYIAYHPRRRPNIVQSLVDLHWATSVQ